MGFQLETSSFWWGRGVQSSLTLVCQKVCENTVFLMVKRKICPLTVSKGQATQTQTWNLMVMKDLYGTLKIFSFNRQLDCHNGCTTWTQGGPSDLFQSLLVWLQGTENLNQRDAVSWVVWESVSVREQDVKWCFSFELELITMRSLHGLPRWLSGKEPTCQCRSLERRRFHPWVGKFPWSRKWQPTPVFLPRKFHGQRILVGYVPWSRKKLAMTEWLNT